ncbi:MAG: fibronectin type III domain-containing protein [Desulfobacterales bacterium]
MPEIKRIIIAAKLGLSLLLMPIAVAMLPVLSGCGEYGHIPLASKKHTDEKADTVQVTLQWNNVPEAVSYNVYWSRFPGVTKHNGHKIPDAANPIALTDLEPDTTYYFVVTVVDNRGESKESREMSFAGMGAAGAIDFKDLFEQPSPSPPPPAVKQEKTQPVKQVPAARQKKAQTSGSAEATLAWDNVPGALSYNIYWRNQPGVTKLNGKKIANVKNPHTLNDLIPGKTYYLVVTAVSNSGESSISEEISHTVE